MHRPYLHPSPDLYVTASPHSGRGPLHGDLILGEARILVKDSAANWLVSMLTVQDFCSSSLFATLVDPLHLAWLLLRNF